ncbi:hypothetical protein [Sporosarcina ureilytica]|uniref:Uncharacterized protein n=1 Tax=Sporosarcina ureilytica TaxID=298596 RepID=A0A1D8JFJ8_9BACL|nr:hypothetical protein [Sporosarcina ureilytica]AOV07487.1 hypothetical protein BI350_08020 [Sporosarcina ureilytica]
MKLVSYLKKDHISVGIVEEDTIIDLNDTFPDMLSIINAGADGEAELKRALANGSNKVPLNSCELLLGM